MMFASDTWADQLIFPPWIDDEGREGVLFNQAFKDAGGRFADRNDTATPQSFSLHSTGDSNV